MEIKNITITPAEASKLIGWYNPQAIREALKQNKVPYGYAVKMTGKWSYVIIRKKFLEYFGIGPARSRKRMRQPYY